MGSGVLWRVELEGQDTLSFFFFWSSLANKSRPADRAANKTTKKEHQHYIIYFDIMRNALSSFCCCWKGSVKKTSAGQRPSGKCRLYFLRHKFWVGSITEAQPQLAAVCVCCHPCGVLYNRTPKGYILYIHSSSYIYLIYFCYSKGAKELNANIFSFFFFFSRFKVHMWICEWGGHSFCWSSVNIKPSIKCAGWRLCFQQPAIFHFLPSSRGANFIKYEN